MEIVSRQIVTLLYDIRSNELNACCRRPAFRPDSIDDRERSRRPSAPTRSTTVCHRRGGLPPALIFCSSRSSTVVAVGAAIFAADQCSNCMQTISVTNYMLLLLLYIMCDTFVILLLFVFCLWPPTP